MNVPLLFETPCTTLWYNVVLYGTIQYNNFIRQTHNKWHNKYNYLYTHTDTRKCQIQRLKHTKTKVWLSGKWNYLQLIEQIKIKQMHNKTYNITRYIMNSY